MENLAQFVGRFHPVFVHLPIGTLLVAILFDWLSNRKRFDNLSASVNLLYFLGGITAIFSCITGYLLSTSGEYEGATLDQHMWMGIGVAIFAFVIYGLRKVSVLQQQKWSAAVPFSLFILISLTGHLGGSLTHGEDYLYVHAPEPFRTWLLGEPKPQIVIENVQKAEVYAEIVAPILEGSCYKCHNEKKQKGKLRLDSPEFIARGGKSKTTTVKAGVPLESELIKRLLLPQSDEKHMPPSKKDELTSDQVELLQWWIAHGADYEAKVKDLPQSEEIKPILAALENPEAAAPKKDFPDVEVAAANPKAITALQDIRAVVLPIGQESNLLSVNYINVEEVSQKEMELLEPIQKQIVWLKLSESEVDDEHISIIADMPNLTKLYLDYTKISDEGLKRLTKLEQLKYLNLVGTGVSTEGLTALKQMSALENVFIYQTNTSSSEKVKLLATLERIEVDTGGYVVPTLEKDTTMLTIKQ
ncbi:MAG: c-type cytochrome domain-containing protein [Bacteroidota bacterium]